MLLSNISSKNKIHDVILFEPIEKQIHDELVALKNFTYEIGKNYCLFKMEHALMRVSVEKGKVNISVEGNYEHYKHYNTNLWDDIKPFEIELKVNVDVSKDWDKVIAYLDNINDFQKEYITLSNTTNILDSDVENELGKYINNNILKCRYHTSATSLKFGFWITKKDGAPADGAYYDVIDLTHLEIHEFMNLDNLIRHLYLGNDIVALKQKIDIINYIGDKDSKFDLNNFPIALTKYQHVLKVRALVNKYGIKSRYSYI